MPVYKGPIQKLSDLENMLDSIKGEDSLFKLYREGRYQDIRDIKQVFLDTKIYAARRLDDFLVSNKPKVVAALEAEKGMGKSTLASVLVLNDYMDKKISYVNYYRYDKQSKKFNLLFREGGTDSDSRRVTVVDDLHYMLPDFYQNVFVKGSVRELDNFIKALVDLGGPHSEREAKSTMLYVSDTFAFEAFRLLYEKLLFAANRGDLIKLLPNISSSSEVGKPIVDIDSEFYGKTYSLLGGDIKAYDTAARFASIMRQDTGMLATNPRLLRKIIGKVREYDVKLRKSMFKDEEVGGKIVSGEISNLNDIERHYSGRFKELTQNTIREIELNTEKIENRLRRSVDSAQTSMKAALDVVQKIGGWSDDKLFKIHEKTGSVAKKDLYFIGDLDISRQPESIKSAWKDSQSLEHLQETYKYAHEKINALSLAMRKNTGVGVALLDDSRREIVSLSAAMSSVPNRMKREAQKLRNNVKYYSRILKTVPIEREKYEVLKASCNALIAENLDTVIESDLSEIKKAIEDPSKLLDKFNLNNLSVISNLTIIPYYSNKW